MEIMYRVPLVESIMMVDMVRSNLMFSFCVVFSDLISNSLQLLCILGGGYEGGRGGGYGGGGGGGGYGDSGGYGGGGGY